MSEALARCSWQAARASVPSKLHRIAAWAEWGTQLTGVQASPWNPALHVAHVHRFSVYVSQLSMTGHTSQVEPVFE